MYVSLCQYVSMNIHIYADSHIIQNHIITALAIVSRNNTRPDDAVSFLMNIESNSRDSDRNCHWEQQRGGEGSMWGLDIDMQCSDYKQKCRLNMMRFAGILKVTTEFVGFELCNTLLNYLICESQKLFSNRKTSKIEWLDFLCYWSLLFYFNIKFFEV